MKFFISTAVYFLLFAISCELQAQNYQLVWEDNFNGTTLDSSKWNVEQREGVWNTGGNKEFQHYKKENVTVGDDGNGNNCLIITAKKESFNGYDYTSGRINTKGKFAFRRGKIEAMIKMPDLANGLWPAFWTLGYTPIGWPDCGEIDILEMGHAAGIAQNKQNSYMGAHLFWGPYPSDWGKSYIASEDLSTGYFKHTAVWTESSISVFFNDSKTPYFTMGIDGNTTEEFRNFQDYIILNLAVGGSVPGIYNKSDITAKMPASMYVDWVKVYQETEDLTTNELPLYGLFGIYEDNSGTDMRMDLGYDLTEKTIGLTKLENQTAYAGNQSLAYSISANSNYELKLTAGLNRNMTNYANGSVQFYLKTNNTEPIQIGISDQEGNEAYIIRNATSDGKWHLVYLPLNEVSSKVDLSKLNDMLILRGTSSSESILAIDEVVYSETVPSAGYFGIYTNNPNITNKFVIDNVSNNLYNWSNTVSFNSSYSAYDGEEALSFRSSGAANWWGFGFNAGKALNFENFANGYLNLALRTETTENFSLSIQGANSTEGKIQFTSGKDLYGFVRDGHWHKLSIPMVDLTKQGLNLSSCGNIFTMSGSSVGNVAVDDIYLSEEESTIENPSICYPVSLVISPKNSSTKTGKKKQFNTTVKDQFSNKTDAIVEYSCSGGTISETGSFSSNEAGTFTIWAKSGDLADSTILVVEQATGINNPLDDEIELHYFPDRKQLEIRSREPIQKIEIYNLNGTKVSQLKTTESSILVNMSSWPQSVYLLSIETRNGIIRKKISRW